MRVALTSDTYGHLPLITDEFDLFIHCGNFCPPTNDGMPGSINQQQWMEHSFNPWLKTIPAKQKVISPGQSDIAVSMLEPSIGHHFNGIYLRDETTTIDGMIVHATPWITMSNKNIVQNQKSFISLSEKAYQGSLDMVPKETNILITRLPPYGILDEENDGSSVGNSMLRELVESLSDLQMHFFSFPGKSMGQHVKESNKLYANACMLDIGYMEIVA